MSEAQPLPPCRLLVRSKTSLEVFTCPDGSTTTNHDNGNNNGGGIISQGGHNNNNTVLLQGVATTFQHITPNGAAVFVHVPGCGIIKIDLTTSSSSSSSSDTKNTATRTNDDNKKPFFADTANVQLMCLSPRGNYAVTWERLYPEKCPLNLKVWDCRTGQLRTSFLQKSLARESWPYIQWTYDEKYVFHLVTNSQLRIYVAETFSNSQDEVDTSTTQPPRYVHHLNVKGCTSFTLPQATSRRVAVQEVPTTDSNDATSATTTTSNNTNTNNTYYFTSFVPVTKDKPASVVVHSYNPATASVIAATGDNNTKSSAFTSIASKSLFQAESCSTYWSPNNDGVLITLQTSVDKTGQSYYGNSQLFLWNNNNIYTTSKNDMLAVPLPQDGPIQAIEWVPDPNKTPIQFVVIAGKMPAMTSLHHGVTGKPLFVFGNNVHRNTIKFSNHGRFFVLGGFGNLAGGISFWDINKRKLLPHLADNVNGTIRAEAVTQCEWAPHSRLFMIATCSPRMNVDNQIRLYKYTGEEITTGIPWENAKYKPDQLLQAAFIPASSSDVYPDRPQTPPPERPIETAATTRTTSAAAAASAANKTATTSVPSKSAAGGGKYVPPSARGRVMGGSSLAERLRQEKQGSVQGAGKVGGTQYTGGAAKGPISALTGKVIPGLAAPTSQDTKTKNAVKREKQKLKKQQQEEQEEAEKQQTAAAAAAAASSTINEPDDADKRSRKIKKLLKQIDELKARDPTTLNDDQRLKVGTESELLAELQRLGI